VLLDALRSYNALRERVNRTDVEGRTLLMRIHNGEDVWPLLDGGAHLAGVDLEGLDAFSHAMTTQNGYVYQSSVLEELLAALPSDKARRERVNSVDEQDCSSLLVMSRNASDVRALLRAGADPCAVDEDGHDAFWHALHIEYDFVDGFEENPESIIAMLLAALHPKKARRARVNLQEDDSGTTPLMLAYSGDDAQAMLDAGAEPRAVTDDGLDALDVAMENDNVDVARVILHALGSVGQRVRVNRADDDGRTLLMICNDNNMATMLLDAGADVRAVDGNGDDALDHAVVSDDEDDNGDSVFTVLLASLGAKARRARVNRRDATTGGTLLMRARSSGHVRALLDAGADVRAVDNAGQDAFIYAARLAAAGDTGALRALRDSLCYDERIAVTLRADLQALGVTGHHWGE